MVKKMKINISKVFIYFVVFIFLFEDTISSLININFLSYMDELTTLGLLLVSFISTLYKKRIKTVSFKLLCLTFLFSLIGTISCFINSEFILSRVIYSNFLAIKFLITIISVSNLDIKKSTYKYIFEAMVFYGIVNAMIGIYNFIFAENYYATFPFVEKSYRYGFPSLSGMFNHPGKYGWFMLATSIISYLIYRDEYQKKNKKYFILSLVFAISALLSFRTKVIMGLAIVIAYEMFVKNIKRINPNKIMIALIGIIAVIVIFNDLIENTYNLYFTNNIIESARQSLLTNSIKIMNDYFPLGVGFGQYGSWYARIYYSSYYWKYKMTSVYGLYPSNPIYATDTYWPSIFGETGIIGAIIYIYILFYIFKMLKKNNIKNLLVSNIAILLLVQTICESFGEPSFNSSPQCIIVALIVGIGLSNIKEKKEE